METFFTLDESLEDASTTRPTRLVSSGLTPTAEVPTTRQKGTAVSARIACPVCGATVLAGTTAAKTVLHLDDVPTYCLQWDAGMPLPKLVPSRGYPVHRCREKS